MATTESIDEEIIDPHHKRRDLRMLAASLKSGRISQANVPKELMEALGGILAGSITRSSKAGKEREVIAGVKAVTELMKLNLEIAKAVDIDARLDQGDPTEITQIKIVDETE